MLYEWTTIKPRIVKCTLIRELVLSNCRCTHDAWSSYFRAINWSNIGRQRMASNRADLVALQFTTNTYMYMGRGMVSCLRTTKKVGVFCCLKLLN